MRIIKSLASSGSFFSPLGWCWHHLTFGKHSMSILNTSHWQKSPQNIPPIWACQQFPYATVTAFIVTTSTIPSMKFQRLFKVRPCQRNWWLFWHLFHFIGQSDWGPALPLPLQVIHSLTVFSIPNTNRHFKPWRKKMGRHLLRIHPSTTRSQGRSRGLVTLINITKTRANSF